MGKGKGKAGGASPRGGTRQIAPVRIRTPKVKPAPKAAVPSYPLLTSATTTAIATAVAGAAAAAAGAAARTGSIAATAAAEAATTAASTEPSTKKSKKARSSPEGGKTSAASKRPTGQQPGASVPEVELFKVTCTCPHLGDHPARTELLRKLVDVRIECRDCTEHTLDELDDVLTCLECGYTGCASPPNRHALRHCLTEPGDAHCFAVSRTRAELFCARCCDYVYDIEFDAAVSRTDDDFGFRAEWGGCREEADGVRSRRRRRARANGHYLVTDRFGQEPGRDRSWPPPVLLSPSRARLVEAGVRGMFNLGNTCFMSSVLQAVLHISVMQSFFSGKGHEPAKCEKLRKETTRLRYQIQQFDAKASLEITSGGSDGKAGKTGAKGGAAGSSNNNSSSCSNGSAKSNGHKKLGYYCIACELARLFEDLFSTQASSATMDDTEPYVPNRLLEAIWSASELLAGYEQQDAHEFLIAILDNLHVHLERAAKNESSAPGLRRTLAAHKQRAKQQQQQQQQQQEQQRQSQEAREQQQQKQASTKQSKTAQQLPQKTQKQKHSADKGKGHAVAASGVGNSGDVTKSKVNRKRGRKNGESIVVSGREAPLSPTSQASATWSKSHAKVERGVPPPPPRRGDALDHHYSSDGQADGQPPTSLANGRGIAGCPLAPQGFGTGGKAFSELSPQKKELRKERVGSERRHSDRSGAGANGVSNGQCLEDVNLNGFVQEVFAGVTRSDVVCTSCGNVSCTYERFLEVSLPVRPGEHEEGLAESWPSLSPPRNSDVDSVGGGSGGLSSGTARSASGPSSANRTNLIDTAHQNGVRSPGLPTDLTRNAPASHGNAHMDVDADGGKRDGRNGAPGLQRSSPSPARSLSVPAPTRSPPLINHAHAASPSGSKMGVSPGRHVEPGRGPLQDSEEVLSSAASQATTSTGRVSPSSTFSDESAPLGAPGADTIRASAVRCPSSKGVKTSSDVAGWPGGQSCGEVARARSISDCFARFAAKEDLSARMTCESCSGSSVSKTKQMSFCSLPRVLVLHLKRFDAMADKKIDDFVSFPARGLDMGKYLSGWPASPSRGERNASRASSTPRRPPGHESDPSDSGNGDPDPTAAVPAPSLLYDLLAVVNHSGSMAQGHYTAFVKEIGRWFRFDDAWVHEVDEEEVLASEAYILFYFQRGADPAWTPRPNCSSTPPSSPDHVGSPATPSRGIANNSPGAHHLSPGQKRS